jgi:hypothetical protein
MIPARVKWATFAIICIAAAFTGLLKINLKLDTSDTIAVAGLIFTILAFTAVMYSLYAVFAQLRKSMAKPKLKVAFTEQGKTETTIIITQDKKEIHQLNLYIINSGNAITKLFQVEFEIPISLKPSFSRTVVNNTPPYIPDRLSSNKGKRIFPLCDDGNYCVFINSPCEFHRLTLHSEPSSYEEYENEYEIHYTVFGDWSETQEGTLKVKINKQ